MKNLFPCKTNMMKTVFAVLAVAIILASATQVFAASSDIGETAEIVFTSGSMDANDYQYFQSEMAQVSGPVKTYEYLRNNADFLLYHGSRSGSINSFMGLRGNDVDLASALIAMYRYQGIHSRYVVGTVRVASNQVMNWVGVKNLDLAVAVMKDQGIQNVALSTDRSTVDFEHVWVEAELPFGNYRGAGTEAQTINCGTDPTKCHWISLDPSFKQKVYNDQGIDPYSSLQFDYTSYYNAIKNTDTTRTNKNPLEIYEEQILAWLQTNYPGKTLEDVTYTGAITPLQNLILPASLPYTIVNTPRRYNSVADHDAAVPATEPKKWGKNVTINFYLVGNISGGGTLTINVNMGPVLVSDLATKRLTLTAEINGSIPNVVLRLAGTEIARPISGSGSIGGYTPAYGDPFTITASMDGAPAPTSSGTDQTITAAYNGIIGGYYLVAAGGETSNWTQVHRAANELLASDQQYKVVFNTSESGCQSDGTNCTPYVDINGTGVYSANDPKLLDDKPALDALTGGLLQVAAMQYYAKYRDSIGLLDQLNHVKTPISGFLGVVSTTHQVEYISGTAFSVLPGGLLIDMRGIQVNGSWRIDQPALYSSTHFLLAGHVGSSLEHEIWQELTGYDAVSTVRGIQMALAQGASLINPIKNSTSDTLPSLYASLGFGSSVPLGFTYKAFTLWTTAPSTWTNSVQGSEFDLFKSVINTSTSSNRLPSAEYQYSTTSGLYGWVNCVNTQVSQLTSYGNQSVSGSTCDGTPFSGPASTVLTTVVKPDYFNTIIPQGIGQDFFNYFDRNQGFVSTDYVYRAAPPTTSQHSTSFVVGVRNDLYYRDITQGWVEYLLPSTQTTGSTYRFTVYLREYYDTATGELGAQTFGIINNSLSAGGGYVDGSACLKAANSIVGTSNFLPTFNNAVFTDKNTVSQTNNDIVKTPSTNDPASTVTGNNYHDETDFTIKGRGINIAFTRTYNSAPSSTGPNGTGPNPLGYGWTHSYNMKLISNDYGPCPNCSCTQASLNCDGKTDSITYVDERGGQHNYLVNSSTYAVTPPTGEFDTLALDSPSTGYYTLTFRNGVKYVFQGTNLKTTPGKTATLSSIQDPYGNQLNFTYTSGNLTSVTDNLGISGRTGLVLTYYASNQLKDITDWSGRKWSYVYDTYGNLASVTNPLQKIIKYSYNPASTHNLSLVTLPEVRSGTPVTTSYSYYQNGKTFQDADALGNTETLDFDLYRKITRVTDPRGFIRQYEYDQNGLMTKMTEADNGILMFGNNLTDLLRNQKTDALGYATKYSYRNDHTTTGSSDTGGNVTQEQDPLSNTLQYTYGVYDQVATAKDKDGNTRTMAYYSTTNPSTGAVAGKLQSVTLGTLNGTSNVVLRTYTYNPDGTVKQMVEYIDPANLSRQRITNYTYQSASNGLNLQSVAVTGATQGMTVTTSYTYDTLGRKLTSTLSRRKSSTDPTIVSLTTTYQYDALDRITQVTDPVGNYVVTVYDGDNKVSQVNGYYLKSDGVTYDSRMGISVKAYDAADRLISDTDIYGNVTQYAYDAAGNLIQTTDPNGHVTTYQYDAMNRRTAVIDANGFKSQTVYDLAGRPIQAINPLGKIVQTAYDALGRPLTITDPMSGKTTFTYDGNGNVLTTTDANANTGVQPKNSYGVTVYKQYDELNRVKLEVDALNGQTKYTYDLLGNITSITDAQNNITYFDYDDLGRLIDVKDPLYATTGKATVFTYDEAGNVLTRTNRSGAQAVYTYDLLNRQTNTQYTSTAGTVSETTLYDIFGNKQSAANADVTYTFYYDLKNRLTQKTDSRVGKSIYFAYDNAGNIKSSQKYDGSTTFFTYDSANKLISETNQNFLQTSYQYDAAGRLLNRIESNGAMTGYTYDDDNRLLSLTNTSATNTVTSTTYLRDWLGNITSQTDSSGITTFVYDADYRLTSATYPNSSNSQSFTYDKVGNRLTKTMAGTTLAYVYDVDNRLKEIHQGTSTGPLQNSFTYDDDGNRTAKKDGSGNIVQSLAYDPKGRVKTIATNGVGISTTLTYDPMDYRIAKTDSKGSLSYLLEGERIDAIMSGSQFQATYLRGSVVDEVVNGFQYNTSGVWTNYNFHHDMLQSVVGLSGHNGTILQLTTYGPFGEKFTDVGGNSNNCLGWTGREHDPDTGLIYFRARYEDPATGGFISEDPLGFKAGVNFYVLAKNNPINKNDPTGQYVGIDDAWFAGGGAVIGLASQGIHDLMSWKLSSWKDYTAAGVGGAVGGEALLYSPFIPGGPFTAGAAGGLATNLTKQALYSATDSNYNWDYASTVFDTTVGAATGFIGDIQIPGISAGRGSFNSIFNQMSTKLENGTISSLTDTTAAKMFAGKTTESGVLPATVGTDFASDAYDWTKSQLTDSETSAAGGGFLIYPNKPNNNMSINVYSK